MLNDQTVVMIGGAGLLGRSLSGFVARNGARVVVADRDVRAASEVADEIAGAQAGTSLALGIDITDQHSINGVIRAAREHFGRIDAVVNCAYPRNANYGHRMEDVTYLDFCDNVSMHLGGYFLVAQQFAAMFRAQGAGNIINFASVYGLVAPRFEIYDSTEMTMPVEYAAIKAAVIHLTKYMAKYLMGTGVRCNTISPGGILNGQPEPFVAAYGRHSATRGMLGAEDVSGLVLFLLSAGAEHITGQNLVVDDGFTL